MLAMRSCCGLLTINSATRLKRRLYFQTDHYPKIAKCDAELATVLFQRNYRQINDIVSLSARGDLLRCFMRCLLIVFVVCRIGTI